MFKWDYLAEQLEISVAQLAEDMWTLGNAAQASHGAHIDTFREKHPQILYLLDHEREIAKTLYFVNKDGMIYARRWFKWSDAERYERKYASAADKGDRLWSGGHGENWAWQREWLKLWNDWEDPTVQERKENLWREWCEYYIPPPVTRNHNQDLEEIDTTTIAHRMDAAGLLSHWLQRNKHHSRVNKWLAEILIKQSDIMRDELTYRTQAQPKQRSSQKKTNAARRDWTKAADYLEQSQWRGFQQASAFYAPEFIKAFTSAALPLDLSVDYEALPQQLTQKKPAERMTYRELWIRVFQLLADDVDADDFQREDIQQLEDLIRKHLKAMRHEHIKKGLSNE